MDCSFQGTRAYATVLLAAGAAVLGVSGCGTGTAAKAPRQADSRALFYLASVPSHGLVMVNSSKKTVYRFSRDTKGSGRTHCYGACARLWRPQLSSQKPAGESAVFHPERFGRLERRSGDVQATYEGWPLYALAGAERPMAGAGMKSFGGTWYALRANGESVR